MPERIGDLFDLAAAAVVTAGAGSVWRVVVGGGDIAHIDARAVIDLLH